VIRDADGFSAADALFLDRIAVKTGDHTWMIEKASLLDAIEAGIGAEEIHEFLAARSDSPVPDNVAQFIDDIIRRANLVSFEGAAEVFRAADEATALLILHDSAAKSLCYAAGPTRLVVPAKNIAAFRRALRGMGFVAASGRLGG
jgi:hypothetical protein